MAPSPGLTFGTRTLGSAPSKAARVQSKPPPAAPNEGCHTGATAEPTPTNLYCANAPHRLDVWMQQPPPSNVSKNRAEHPHAPPPPNEGRLPSIPGPVAPTESETPLDSTTASTRMAAIVAAVRSFGASARFRVRLRNAQRRQNTHECTHAPGCGAMPPSGYESDAMPRQPRATPRNIHGMCKAPFRRAGPSPIMCRPTKA